MPSDPTEPRGAGGWWRTEADGLLLSQLFIASPYDSADHYARKYAEEKSANAKPLNQTVSDHRHVHRKEELLFSHSHEAIE